MSVWVLNKKSNFIWIALEAGHQTTKTKTGLVIGNAQMMYNFPLFNVVLGLYGPQERIFLVFHVSINFHQRLTIASLNKQKNLHTITPTHHFSLSLSLSLSNTHKLSPSCLVT